LNVLEAVKQAGASFRSLKVTSIYGLLAELLFALKLAFRETVARGMTAEKPRGQIDSASRAVWQ
jgi:hypothetical protein